MPREKPQFGAELQRALEHNKKLAKQGYVKSGGKPAYENDWTRDSSINSFGQRFFNTMPGHPTASEILKSAKPGEVIYSDMFEGNFFRNDIVRTLEKNEHKVAVELGGSGSKLFTEGFPPGTFVNTLGICLHDIRTDTEKDNDISQGHTVIEDDIMDPNNDALDQKIREVLRKDRIDLIICSMMAPLNFLNRHPAILDRLIRKWYSWLPNNGLIFAQFRYQGGENMEIETKIKKWADIINATHPDTIEITLDPDLSVLRLHKKPGAPDKLPAAAKIFAQAN
ncbi:MAG: hypothetical protein M3M85_03545 [bacterium]|nr:hypothetical protein [bacterium]